MAKSKHDRIAQKAYEMYERDGKVDGRALNHWLEAEQAVSAKAPRTRATKRTPAPGSVA